MNIYKAIAKDLRAVKATPLQAHLAFVALSVGKYLQYIEQLKERHQAAIRAKEELT